MSEQPRTLKIYLIIGTLIAGVLGGAIQLWKVSVDRAALVEWNRMQSESVVKEQAKFAEEARLIREELQRVLEATEKMRADLDETTRELDELLSDPDTVDRPSSQVLKDTVRILGGQK